MGVGGTVIGLEQALTFIFPLCWERESVDGRVVFPAYPASSEGFHGTSWLFPTRGAATGGDTRACLRACAVDIFQEPHMVFLGAFLGAHCKAEALRKL